MRPKSPTPKATPGERVVQDIKRATRRQFSAEEKIRIILDGLRGEDFDRRTLSPRGHCAEPVLCLVEGVPGSRQAAPGGRYGARRDHRRSKGSATRSDRFEGSRCRAGARAAPA